MRAGHPNAGAPDLLRPSHWRAEARAAADRPFDRVAAPHEASQPAVDGTPPDPAGRRPPGGDRVRVCLLTPEFLPTWGGVGTYTYNLARALRGRAEVHVVTSARGRMAAEADDLDGVQVHAIEADGGRTDGLGLAFQLAVLRRLPGLATLLRSVSRLDPEVRLLLAGPGDTTRWTRYADRLGVGRDRYEFLGPVPYGHMPALYHRADAVVLPSFAESCPMVALEAMACGTQLIAARAGGVTEIVRDGATGWLFPPGDVDGLVDRIETVFANPVRAEEIANGGRDWVERNGSVDRMAERTFRFYKVVAGEAS